MICGRRWPPLPSGIDDGDTWKEDDTCSYCGGTNPDKIIKLMKESGYCLSPTDKDYKYYVNAPMEGNGYSSVKLYIQHCSQEQLDQINEIRTGVKA